MPSVTPPTQDRVDAYWKELNNWGRWGHDDQRGTVNLVTPPEAGGGARAGPHRPHGVDRARRSCASRS